MPSSDLQTLTAGLGGVGKTPKAQGMISKSRRVSRKMVRTALKKGPKSGLGGMIPSKQSLKGA